MRYAAALFLLTVTLTQAGEESKLAGINGVLPDSIQNAKTGGRLLLDQTAKHLLFHDGASLSVLQKDDGARLWNRPVVLSDRRYATIVEDRVYAVAWNEPSGPRDLRVFKLTTGEPVEPLVPMTSFAEHFFVQRIHGSLFVSNAFPTEMQATGHLFRIDFATGKPLANTFVQTYQRMFPFALSGQRIAIGGEIFDAESLKQPLELKGGQLLSKGSVRWFSEAKDALFGFYSNPNGTAVKATARELKQGTSLWDTTLPQAPEAARAAVWDDTAWATRAESTLVFARSWGLMGLDAQTGKLIWEQHLPLARAGYGSGESYYSEAKNDGTLKRYMTAEFNNLEPRHFPETMFRITAPHPYEFRIACPPFCIGESTFVLVNYCNVMPGLFRKGIFAGRHGEMVDWTKRNLNWKTKDGKEFESDDRIVLLKIDALTGQPLEHQTLATRRQAREFLISENGTTLFIATQAGGLLRVDFK